MKLKSIILSAVAGVISFTANAVTLQTASFDTSSYVFLGTSSQSSPSISVSEYMSAGHFSFGVIEFDVSSLETTGDKYLNLRGSGSYAVNVGVMPAPLSDYFNSPSDSGPPPPGTGKTPWFNANILPLTPIDTLTFVDQQVASLDVTDEVNDWITSTTDNYGFVIWSTTPGSVSIDSVDSTGFVPELNSVPVPEPQTYALLGGLAALGVAFFRRRK